jgi:hypothetical protein
MFQENHLSESYAANAESADKIIKSETINDFAPAATQGKPGFVHSLGQPRQQQQNCPTGTADWGACTEIDYTSWGGGKGSCLLGDVLCKCDPSMTSGNYGWICNSVESVEVDVVRSP